MFSPALVVLVSFAYLLLLVLIALYADRRAQAGRSLIDSPTVYALSLGVYCTAWTYFGSVGRAASSGIGFLPVYLGPTLGMALSWLVMLKMVRIAKTYRLTSIADFIASRHGKSHLLGGLVTVIAAIGIVPYIALQLKAVSSAFALLVGQGGEPVDSTWLGDSTLLIALALAGFTVFFGTRALDASERHEGMVAAIAFESLIKLVAFLCVGLFVTYGLFDGAGEIFTRAAQMPELANAFALPDWPGWLGMTLLSMLSVILLPRQFQVIVVENTNEQHLRRASWMFPAYLLLINLFVLPIALGGLMIHGLDGTDPDSFVLSLPLAHEQPALALFVFLGGLSAATGMIIVESIALSTMICNDLVMPLLLRNRAFHRSAPHDLSGLLLAIRRIAIVAIVLLGYLYFRVAGEAQALVGIGLISFAAIAQFAPAMLGGLYWRGGTRAGALAGLSAGFAVWAYTLLLPSFAESGWLDTRFVDHGAFGLAALRPQALFGLEGLDNITHGLFWSLLLNAGLYFGLALLRPPSALEASQASLFVDIMRQRPAGAADFWRGSADVGELRQLLARFLGEARAQALFARHAQTRGLSDASQLQADAELVHLAETHLAGAIGSASARAMIATVVREEPLGLDEVLHILDEANEVRAYSRQLEEKSRELEAATAELREANTRLQELDRLKDDFMSSVSHELRTPLTSIRALSEMLNDDPEMPAADRQRFLSIIASESERLTRLVNQILDMAKIESGRAEWRVETVDLGEIVDASVASLESLIRSRGVELRIERPNQPLVLQADRDRLQQVLLNLLGNALKFVPAGKGRIAIQIEREDKLLKVCVADNGPGIAAEHQAAIFEKFRQGGDTLTDKPQGTGLGLPISREIVTHLGGQLWVESNPQLEPGARFIFTLPCA